MFHIVDMLAAFFSSASYARQKKYTLCLFAISMCAMPLFVVCRKFPFFYKWPFLPYIAFSVVFLNLCFLTLNAWRERKNSKVAFLCLLVVWSQVVFGCVSSLIPDMHWLVTVNVIFVPFSFLIHEFFAKKSASSSARTVFFSSLTLLLGGSICDCCCGGLMVGVWVAFCLSVVPISLVLAFFRKMPFDRAFFLGLSCMSILFGDGFCLPSMLSITLYWMFTYMPRRKTMSVGLILIAFLSLLKITTFMPLMPYPAEAALQAAAVIIATVLLLCGKRFGGYVQTPLSFCVVCLLVCAPQDLITHAPKKSWPQNAMKNRYIKSYVRSLGR